MNELTNKELSGYYGYNLLLKDITNDAICNLKVLHKDCVEVEYYNNVGNYELNFEDIRPILYPTSFLIKEVTHNGKTFIPMVELAKICHLDSTKCDLGSRSDSTFGIRCNIGYDEDCDTHMVLGFDLINGFGLHYRPSKKWTIVCNQMELWSKLFEWKIDIFSLIEKELAIAVTEDFNPYK